MFGRHRRDLLDARDREVAALKLVIESLAEQIEYLRIVMGQPNLSRAKTLIPADEQSPELVEGLKAYLSEEEQDLIALRDNGHIDEIELERELAAAGLRSSHLTLA